MHRFVFWQRWLLAVALAVTAFGLFMALSAGSALFAPFAAQVDPAFWGEAALPDAARHFQRWIYGAWGATVAGWGVLLACVAGGPFRRREGWAWWGMALALGLWYVVDTGISLAAGVWFNVAFNSLLLGAAGLPLACTWRAVAQRPQANRGAPE